MMIYREGFSTSPVGIDFHNVEHESRGKEDSDGDGRFEHDTWKGDGFGDGYDNDSGDGTGRGWPRHWEDLHNEQCQGATPPKPASSFL